MRPDVPTEIRAFQHYYEVGLAAVAGMNVAASEEDRGACCGMSGVGLRGRLEQCPACMLLWHKACQSKL
eukprot:10909067-Alexandrium_andersonii.AAC.1